MRNYIKIVILNFIFGLFILHTTSVLGKINTPSNISDSHKEITLSTKNIQLLNVIIDNVKRYYYKPMDEDTLVNMAISGMISNLDPHSAFLNQSDLKELELEISGKFGGIGVLVVPDHGVIKVISPIDDTPACRAGIKAGDYIIQINNKLVRDMTLSAALSMMRGKKGSMLSLTIIRKNESKPKVIRLRREIIRTQSVKERLLEPGYGYIRLAIFQELTEKDMIRAINRLQKTSKGGIKGLVLDMRNNPGGLFDAAVQVANNFLDGNKLKENKLIVYTQGQDEEMQVSYSATAGELLPDVPLVVLINGGSASAAEIVAGALQDHKRAIIAGERSFGKGSVQVLYPIDKKRRAITLTAALYYTPFGHLIQAKGIKPDIEVGDIQVSQNPEEQILPRIDESALIDHIRNSDDEDSAAAKKEMLEQQTRSKSELQLAKTDLPLYEALHILKSLNVLKNKGA